MRLYKNTHKTALYGILGALALVLSLFENILLPDLPFLPAGAKPGLSNIVNMCSAYILGGTGAFYITFLKALFALITRGATAGLMSFCGGVLSTLALCLMIKYEGRFYSFLGIGIVCAVCHNAGQLFMSALLTGTFHILNYGKYLLIFALISGTLTGIILNILKPRLKEVNKQNFKT